MLAAIGGACNPLLFACMGWLRTRSGASSSEDLICRFQLSLRCKLLKGRGIIINQENSVLKKLTLCCIQYKANYNGIPDPLLPLNCRLHGGQGTLRGHAPQPRICPILCLTPPGEMVGGLHLVLLGKGSLA